MVPVKMIEGESWPVIMASNRVLAARIRDTILMLGCFTDVGLLSRSETGEHLCHDTSLIIGKIQLGFTIKKLLPAATL
jgi:hypothetical protein